MCFIKINATFAYTLLPKTRIKDMEITIKKIAIITGICVCLIMLPYVVMFYQNGLSGNPYDWSSFATYFNGLIVPVLSFANIFVLLSVKQAVSNISKEKYEHNKTLRKYNKKDYGGFKVEIDTNLTIEDNLHNLENHLAQIRELFNILNESDQGCEDDVYELAELAKLSKKSVKAIRSVPYYMNPFCNRMWEIHNLAVNNTLTLTTSELLQIKVKIYELLCRNSNSNDLHDKYITSQKELEDFHESSMILD